VSCSRHHRTLTTRLSEANLGSILAEVEKLFGDYSRNDVTTTLTKQVIEMIGSKTNLLDSFVVLYATLVGALHRVVGLEFGAHFVQTVVKKYSELAAKSAAEEAPSAAASDAVDTHKEAFNLLTLIAELYNAGVVGAGLIYDLVRGFIGTGDEIVGERSVEGLLKILKCELTLHCAVG
jgi:nucleolar MIF4G domain-containing protein 1